MQPKKAHPNIPIQRDRKPVTWSLRMIREVIFVKLLLLNGETGTYSFMMKGKKMENDLSLLINIQTL